MAKTNPAGTPNPDKPEPKRINHESTKGRKHEKKRVKFRVFVMKSAFGGAIKCKKLTTKILIKKPELLNEILQETEELIKIFVTSIKTAEKKQK